MAGKRKDSKGRLLRRGERQREDGTYEFRYQKNGGKRKSVYSSSLEALRKLEDQITMDRIDGIRFNADTVTLDDAGQRRESKTTPSRTISICILSSYPLRSVSARSVN